MNERTIATARYLLEDLRAFVEIYVSVSSIDVEDARSDLRRLKNFVDLAEKELLKSGSGTKTVREWFEEHPDQSCTIVWAADAPGGFGKKGHTVYGDKSGCFIVREDATPGNGLPRLHVWCESFGRIPV